MNQPDTTRLDRIAARYAEKPAVSEMCLAIEQPSTGFTWSHGVTDQPYFVASITKLYTAAMIMQLRDEGALTLDTPAADLLGEETMRGLNVHDGHDYGAAITVRELLPQTSGIPDYFEQKRPDGTTLMEEMVRVDTAWTLDDFIEMARSMPSPFAPSTPGKAQYCDTNYDVLGRIIEVATSGSYVDAFRSRIIEPLGLGDTWLFTPQTQDRYDDVATVLHGNTPVRVPNTIASWPSSGAVVSTAADQVRFLRAFIGGKLFPARHLAEMTAQWRSVFSRFDPLEYGIGIMRFKLPRWMSPFSPVPAMIGHSGAFGSVLYHVPERDLYVAGTVNQMRPRRLPYLLLARLVTQFR